MGIYERLGRLACFFGAVVVSGTSLAQNAPQCACLFPDAGATVPVGELVAVDGDVLMSQPAGYSPASQGMSVFTGAQILVGARSSASFVFGGTCPLEASAGTIVRVDPTPSGVCASVARPADEAAAQAAVADVPKYSNAFFGAVLGLAAVGGGVALIVSSGDDDSVSD